MQTITFSQCVLYFMAYSILGWICETVWCSVGAGKLVDRGFLTGPWCPIYGFGALLILLLAAPASASPVLVFAVSMLATAALEYFTGWLLEVLFQTKWWDYSNRRFNLKGRVCLRNALLFGLLGLLLTYFVHPLFSGWLNAIQPSTQRVFASLLLALMVADLLRSLALVTGLRERLEGMRAVLAELEEYQDAYAWYDKHDVAGSVVRLREICQSGTAKEHAPEILRQIDKLEQRKGSGVRLLAAFPQMQAKGFALEQKTLRESWDAQKKARGAQVREWWQGVRTAARQETKEAYKDITATRMVWVFLMGCIIGYVVETGYCLLTKGVIESRQGMLYGPFNQVYGFGAVLFMLLLAPLARKKNIWLFCGGAVVGGLFEVVCSLVQEALFGTVSWQYTDEPFALFGGRTTLVYMIFWGVLGVVYIRWIYPKFIRLVDEMTPRSRRFFTALIAVSLSLNMLLSAAAVNRWANRQNGLEAGNAVEVFLDENFPDEKMEEIYPNMESIGSKDAESGNVDN